MKICIVEDEEDILDLVQSIVEGTLPDATILTATSLATANQVFDDNDDLDLIISDLNLGDGKGSTLFDRIESEARNTRYFLCSSEPPESAGLAPAKIFGSALKPHIVDPIMNCVKKAAEEVHVGTEIKLPEYVPIRMDNFIKVSPLPCDVYLQLTDEKFVKVSNSGEDFTEADRDRYREKFITHLYIPRDKASEFLHTLTKRVLELVRQGGESDEDISNLSSISHAAVQDHLLSLGVTKEAIELSQENSRMAMKFMKKNPNLRDYVSRLSSDKESYGHAHSMALSLVAGSILSMLEWSTEESHYKLALAAMMHDILLRNPRLAAIQSLEELNEKKSHFTHAEVKAFKEHPIRTAELLRRIDTTPPDVDTIILQHHERPDGSGFPHNLAASRVGKLSALFIIAHDVITWAFTGERELDLNAYLDERESYFTAEQYGKITAGMRAFLNKGR